MNATPRGAAGADEDPIFDVAADFISRHDFDRPTLVVDGARVAMQFDALSAGLGAARIHYAVKANSASKIIRTLKAKGARFFAASQGEIQLCLNEGVPGADITFGNTVKRPREIAFAHDCGIDLFAADAEAELVKIAANAPGARVYLRVMVENLDSNMPPSRKFGCGPAAVPGLLSFARAVGLHPVGLAFHVGGQTRKPVSWIPALDLVAELWHAACAAGHNMTVLNIGGGFPAAYGDAVDGPQAYAAAVAEAVFARFGPVDYLMAEPGRCLVAEAGHIAAEVLLISRKSADDLHRWVYLDIGRFSGLAETEDGAVRYQFATGHGGMSESGPCVLAGPSCDTADVLYEQRPVQLPLALREGDKIVIRNSGAYTSSYSSAGFNGFPPLDVIVL